MNRPRRSTSRLTCTGKSQLSRLAGRSALRGSVARVALAVLSCASLHRAGAANLYWDGGGGATTTWTTLANWDTAPGGGGGIPGMAPGALDTAFFNVSTLNTNQIATLNGALSIGGLVFSSTGTTAIKTNTAANRAITLGSGGITIASGVGAVTFGTTTDTQRVTFTLNGSQIWLNNSSNALVLNANNTIALGGNTLTFDGTGNFTAGAVISGAGGSLIKNGAGSLTLSAANTFTGNFTLNAGTVLLGNNTSWGTTGSVIINGGTISVTANRTTTNSRPYQWNGDWTFGGGGTWNAGTGAVSIGIAAVTLTNSGATLLTVGGSLTGSAPGRTVTVKNNGAGGTTLAGAVGTNMAGITNSGTGTGTTTISGIIGASVTGVIQDGATSQLNLSGANTFTGLLVKRGTVGLGTNNAAAGTGTITLGENLSAAVASLISTSTGRTFVNPIVLTTGATGTLTVAGGSGLAATTYGGGVSGTNNLTLASNGTALTFSTNPINNVGTVTILGSGSTTISGGVGTNVTQVRLTGSGAATISGGLVVNGGNTTLINDSPGAALFTQSGAVTGTGDLILRNNTGTASGVRVTTATVNNTGAITSNGTGSGVTLVSARIEANLTAVNQNSSSSPLTVSGVISAGGGITFNSNATALFTVGTAAITGTGDVVFNANSTGNLTVSSGVNNSATVTNSGTGTGVTTISGVIGSNVTGVIQNSPTSVLVLTGTKTYTSPTTLTAGTLSVSDSRNMGAAASNLIFDGGTLRITGTTLTKVSGAPASGGIGHTVIFNPGKTVGFDIANAGHTFTVDTVLNQGTGGLTKIGPGTLELTGTNTYTGSTTVGTPNGVSGGTLSVNTPSGTIGVGDPATAPLTVYAGTVNLGASADPQYITELNLGGGASGTSALVTVSTDLFVGNLTNPAKITYDASTNAKPATISGTGALKFKTNVTIEVGSSSAGSGVLAPDLTIGAALRSDGNAITNVTKTGLGTLRLVANGSSDLNGSINITAGTLILDGGSTTAVLPSSTIIGVGTGATLNLGASSGEDVTLDSLTLSNDSRLAFNLGSNVVNDYDRLLLLGLPGTGFKMDINALNGFGTGTLTGSNYEYELINATEDLTNKFSLGTTPGGFGFKLDPRQIGVGDYSLFLILSPVATEFFWKGGIDTSWNRVTTDGGGNITSSNWTDSTGASVRLGTPGSVNNVTLYATGSTNPQNTVVDLDTSVNNLTIDQSSGVASVSTIKGVSGTLLTIHGNLWLKGSGTASVLLGSGDVNNSTTWGTNTASDALFLGLPNNASWKNDTLGALIISNQISSQALSGTQILTIEGTGNTTIAGNIIDGGLGGRILIFKDGAGTATLKNPLNSYSGGTTIRKGVLEFAAGALPATGAVTFDGTFTPVTGQNPTLKWLPGNTDDISNRLVINNGMTATLDVGANNVTFGTTIDNAGVAGVLRKAGSGTLTLAADNDTGVAYTGGTTIAEGTLQFVSSGLPRQGDVTFSGSSTLRWLPENSDNISSRLVGGQVKILSGVTATFDVDANDVTFTEAIVNQGTLRKDGAGTLTLMADNTSTYAGATEIRGGTLEFTSASALPNSGSITFIGTSTPILKWSGNSLDISSRVNVASGTTGTLDTGVNNVNFAGAIQASGVSIGNLTKTGLGTLDIQGTANGNFQGGVQVDAGALKVSGSLSGAASVIIAAGATFELAGTGADRIPNAATVTAGVGNAGTPARFVINGVSETMGKFTLTDDAVLDFGASNANAELKFSDSSDVTWNGILSIHNWSGTLDGNGGGADRLFFGTDANGLTGDQLAQIFFYSNNGSALLGSATFAASGDGEIVPVPEPASFLSLLGGAGILLSLRRRQRSA